MNKPSLFRFLYRLAADARQISRDRLLKRVVTGTANHFGATVCHLYVGEGEDPAASADAEQEIERLSALDRARFETLDARLAEAARNHRRVTSALELDAEGDVMDFLSRTLSLTDIFAFPLMMEGVTHGAIILYLGEDASPIGESDAQALMSVAEILALQDDQG